MDTPDSTFPATSVFATTARAILDGRIRMLGDLTRAEKRAVVTPCAMGFIAPERFPGMVGIAHLTGGRMRLSASFQADSLVQWSHPVPPLTVQSTYVEDFIELARDPKHPELIWLADYDGMLRGLLQSYTEGYIGSRERPHAS